MARRLTYKDAAAFCDFFNQANGRRPTVAELVAAVGWPDVTIVKRLVTADLVETSVIRPARAGNLDRRQFIAIRIETIEFGPFRLFSEPAL